MKKLINQFKLVLLLLAITAFCRGNANGASLSSYSGAPGDSCNASFVYANMGDGSFRFLDSLNVYDSAIFSFWDFDDDSITATGYDVQHSYSADKITAHVCHTVTTLENVTCYSCQEIQVRTDTTPNCDAGFTYTQIGPREYAFSANSNAITYEWIFNDSTTASIKNPKFTFVEGTIRSTVCLTINTDLGFCQSCQEIQVVPDSMINCNAYFNYSTYQYDSLGTTARSVRFYNYSSSMEPITQTEWSFGDGSYSNEYDPTHVYYPVSSNPYYVSLSIYAPHCVDTMSIMLDLTDSLSPVECNANFSYNVTTSDSSGIGVARVNFISYSRGNSPIVNYQWNFGDGTYSNEFNPSHAYYFRNELSVNVMLYIESASGCRDSILKELYFNTDTGTPTCQADFSYQIFPKDSLGMKATRVVFQDYSTTNSIIRSYQWQFGDGNYSLSQNPVNTYYPTSAYPYEVTLLIWTANNCTDTAKVYLDLSSGVIPDSCHADFTYSISQIIDTAGTKITYLDLTSTSLSESKLKYFWNEGYGYNTYYGGSFQRYAYIFENTTDVTIGLYIQSLLGCTDSTSKVISIPGNSNLYSLSGLVKGKKELLPEGVIVLYKKMDNGKFSIEDANVVNNGVFEFENLEKGKYILYAIPHAYYLARYLPTYYVNKIHWASANVIDLTGNTGDLTLQLVTMKSLEKGIGKIAGKISVLSDSIQLTNKKLKSAINDASLMVYLATESGEIVNTTYLDESNNYAFDELPYGTYNVLIESVNLPENSTTVNLSSANPVVDNLDFILNKNALSAKTAIQDDAFTVFKVSDETLALLISKSGEYKITFISLAGAVISNGVEVLEANSENLLPIGNLPKGMYIIQLQTGSATHVQKFIK